MHVPQVLKIGEGGCTVALQSPGTSFLSAPKVIEDDYCTVVLHSKVREEHQVAFKELLTGDDGSINCIMSVLGPKGSGTIAEQRNAAFSEAGPDVYTKGKLLAFCESTLPQPCTSVIEYLVFSPNLHGFKNIALMEQTNFRVSLVLTSVCL
jgi:hypothetical protein